MQIPLEQARLLWHAHPEGFSPVVISGEVHFTVKAAVGVGVGVLVGVLVAVGVKVAVLVAVDVGVGVEVGVGVIVGIGAVEVGKGIAVKHTSFSSTSPLQSSSTPLHNSLPAAPTRHGTNCASAHCLTSFAQLSKLHFNMVPSS